MSKLYNIIIQLYVCIIHIHSFINHKSKKWVDGRKNLLKDLKEQINNQKDIAWFHCSSLGEYQQCKELILKYQETFPKEKILLTFFSPSGYDQIKNDKKIDWVFYLPADTFSNANTFINIVNPKKVFFIKSEFWYNYMQILNSKNIPLYHISSLFKKNQYMLKLPFYNKILKKSKHFFVQNKESKLALECAEINQTTIIKDTRFDTILSDIKKNIEYVNIKRYCSKKPTMIFASIWPEDEHLFLDYVNEYSNLRYILVPHELNYCSTLEKKTKGVLYSEFQKKGFTNKNIVIIDSIGMLKDIYKYCNIAYIGGGFGKGIHNTVEAVASGIPVVFGPNYRKFIEARDLISIRAAVSVKTNEEFKKALFELTASFNKEIVMDYINKKAGSVANIINHIKNL